MNIYSQHVFFFPFKWDFVRKDEMEHNLAFSVRINIKKFIGCLDTNCWKEFSEFENSAVDFYNDALFFYDSAREAIFGNLKSKSVSTTRVEDNFIVKNLSYVNKEPMRYCISTLKYGVFELVLDKIRLNIYTQGVGILSFYLTNQNEDKSDPESILRISDFGRRLFPTFLTVSKSEENVDLLKAPHEASFPLEIKILEGNNEIFKEDSHAFLTMKDEIGRRPNKLRNGSQNLLLSILGPSFTLESEQKQTEDQIIIRPTLDDRMFAVCWYGNNVESRKIKWNSKKGEYGFLNLKNSKFWMRFLFMESGDGSAQSRLIRKALAKRHTYHRWADYGTFYAITRSSFVCLTNENDFAKTYIARYMRGMYAEMAQLTLAQHACTLRFSDEIRLLRKKSQEDLLKTRMVHFLLNQYLEFINNLHFKEISPLEQGQELYRQLQTELAIDSGLSKVDKEVKEFTSIMSGIEEKEQLRLSEERNRINTIFSFLATLFLPASFIAAILGLSNLGQDFEFCGTTLHRKFWIAFTIALSASILFLAIFWKRFKFSTLTQNNQ